MKKIAEALRREVASFVLGLSLLFGSSSYAEVMPPTISSFNPLSATNGASVTITGTNFSETLTNNIVWFGAVQATVQSASRVLAIVDITNFLLGRCVCLTVGGKSEHLAFPSHARANAIECKVF